MLVGHSWGGVVIGEAGDDPKVKALVYIAAFAPGRGESVQDLAGNGPPSEGRQAFRPDAKGFLWLDPAAFPRVFAGDVAADEATALAGRQRPIAGQAFAFKAVVAAWHHKPTFYAVSSDDKMLPAQAETFFAQRMKVTTVTLSSSHASPVSHPDIVPALIEQAANGT